MPMTFTTEQQEQIAAARAAAAALDRLIATLGLCLVQEIPR